MNFDNNVNLIYIFPELIQVRREISTNFFSSVGGIIESKAILLFILSTILKQLKTLLFLLTVDVSNEWFNIFKNKKF